MSRASADEDAGAGDEGGAPGAEGGMGAIKRGLVSGMMKKHLVEAVVPVLIELKRQLEAQHHPLLRELRECFCSLLKVSSPWPAGSTPGKSRTFVGFLPCWAPFRSTKVRWRTS